MILPRNSDKVFFSVLEFQIWQFLAPHLAFNTKFRVQTSFKRVETVTISFTVKFYLKWWSNFSPKSNFKFLDFLAPSGLDSPFQGLKILLGIETITICLAVKFYLEMVV